MAARRRSTRSALKVPSRKAACAGPKPRVDSALHCAPWGDTDQRLAIADLVNRSQSTRQSPHARNQSDSSQSRARSDRKDEKNCAWEGRVNLRISSVNIG